MRTTLSKTTIAAVVLALAPACGQDFAAVGLDGAGADENTLSVEAQSFLQERGAELGIGRDDTVTQRARHVDALGQEHVRFERSYRGLPVRGGDFVVHTGEIHAPYAAASVSGALMPVRVSQFPTLTAPDAASLGARDFAGERDGTPQATLVLYALRGPEQLALSYEVVQTGTAPDGTPSILHSFVDAHSGQILDRYDEIETGAATATGKSLYSGSVSLDVNQLTGKYELRDTKRGNGTTVEAQTGAVVTSTTTTFGDGTIKSRASAAADAHYGAARTWDYYKSTHGRSGIGNDGKGATSKVHYGTSYNNAFWSDGCFCMTYGDGDGKSLRPLVAIDVTAHEMTHGVTSRTAKLVYSGESGGLNEATSDIFGTAVEFFAKNSADPGDYLIGEEIIIGKPYLRSMSNPKGDGRSIDHYSLYRAGIDVHLSSGIANNFFYLLSEGGKNATSNLSVTGIGRAKAEKIWYRALTVYFTSSTNFAAARTHTLKAVKDLYGSGGAEEKAVTAAWTAVGVR